MVGGYEERVSARRCRLTLLNGDPIEDDRCPRSREPDCANLKNRLRRAEESEGQWDLVHVEPFPLHLPLQRAILPSLF